MVGKWSKDCRARGWWAEMVKRRVGYREGGQVEGVLAGGKRIVGSVTRGPSRVGRTRKEHPAPPHSYHRRWVIWYSPIYSLPGPLLPSVCLYVCNACIACTFTAHLQHVYYVYNHTYECIYIHTHVVCMQILHSAHCSL